MKVLLCLVVWMFFTQRAQTQDKIKKIIQVNRVTSSMKVDGVIDEPDWQTVLPAAEFVQYNPLNGGTPSQKTEVKVLYSDAALFVSAILYDSAPDSILTELGNRDNNNTNTDYFAIDLCPYNDGLNGFGFFVTVSGVQGDFKYVAGMKDYRWDAVWRSEVRMDEKGWVVEIEIPFSAIRFPAKDEPVWGINFWRSIRRYREESTWNFVDVEFDGRFTQLGELKGIKNIVSPLRLSLIPYLSAYANQLPAKKKWGYSVNGGLDIKYGINESFTLDMTLIPDFGQVQSDDKVLNLTPFETFYSEQRPFFTEGTELFGRADLFYSRRIGGVPDGYGAIGDTISSDSLIENPSVSKMINATKISGRTKKGLGIGFLNAMTSKAVAVYRDEGEHEIVSQPFTNYNILVLDQSLWTNSYISLINTNVIKKDYSDMDNVTGTDFQLVDRTNSYKVRGIGTYSQKNYKTIKDNGYAYKLEIGKTSGNFQAKARHETISETYDPNAQGYLQINNKVSNALELNYNVYKPFRKCLNWFNTFSINYNQLYLPRKYTGINVSYNLMTTLRNHLSIGFDIISSPVESHDYYEPRTPGYFYSRPTSYESRLWLSPDYRKRFVVDLNGGVRFRTKYDQFYYWAGVSPRFRVNDKMLIVLNLQDSEEKNDIGFVDFHSDSLAKDTIYFGTRNISTLTTTFSTSYMFINKASLNFRLRHYWSRLKYNEFFDLQENGGLIKTNYYGNEDKNYNAFTIDMSFVWNFAPGSEFSFIWKNSLYDQGNEVIYSYSDNLDYMFNSAQTNSFSLKVLVYLDYGYLRKKK